MSDAENRGTFHVALSDTVYTSHDYLQAKIDRYEKALRYYAYNHYDAGFIPTATIAVAALEDAMSANDRN